jgi:hypothetical protein
VTPSDRRRLDVEIDAAETPDDANVIDAIIGAGGIVVGLVGLVVQLFLHVGIQQIEIVYVVDLYLRSESRAIAQQDRTPGRGGATRHWLTVTADPRAGVWLISKIKSPGEAVSWTEILVLGVRAQFLTILISLLSDAGMEAVVRNYQVVLVVLVREAAQVALVDLDDLLLVGAQNLQTALLLRSGWPGTAFVNPTVGIIVIGLLLSSGHRLIFVVLLRNFVGILSQYADGVISLFDYRDFGQNSRLELPLLLIVGPRLDIFDLKPLVVQ